MKIKAENIDDVLTIWRRWCGDPRCVLSLVAGAIDCTPKKSLRSFVDDPVAYKQSGPTLQGILSNMKRRRRFFYSKRDMACCSSGRTWATRLFRASGTPSAHSGHESRWSATRGLAMWLFMAEVAKFLSYMGAATEPCRLGGGVGDRQGHRCAGHVRVFATGVASQPGSCASQVGRSCRSAWSNAMPSWT